MSVTDYERKRSIEAYKYVVDGKNIINLYEIGGEFYKDDNYKSYVKKIPMMILNNGSGATFAFIYSKGQKYSKKKNKKAGEKENPKDAYDLISYQIDDWFKNHSFIQKKSDNDLVEWIINLDSSEYRAVTNEVLALFNWLKRFADGMIEGEDNDS